MTVWLGSGYLDPQLSEREALDTYQKVCEEYYSVVFERDALKQQVEDLEKQNAEWKTRYVLAIARS